MMEQNRKDSPEYILRRRKSDHKLLHDMILVISFLIQAAALLWVFDLGIRDWSRETVWMLGLILNLLVALEGVLVQKHWLIVSSMFACVCIILAQIYMLL